MMIVLPVFREIGKRLINAVVSSDGETGGGPVEEEDDGVGDELESAMFTRWLAAGEQSGFSSRSEVHPAPETEVFGV